MMKSDEIMGLQGGYSAARCGGSVYCLGMGAVRGY